MKAYRNKVFVGVLVAVYLSSMILSGAVLATPQQIGTVQPPTSQEPQRGVNPETGRVSFIGAGNPIRVPGVSSATEMTLQDRAMKIANAYGREFGLQNPALELKLLRSVKDRNGNDVIRYQQVFMGVPILAGEMIVSMDPQGNLLSISGEVSPDLALSTQPGITAQAAEQAALTEVAKLHQVDATQLGVSTPELWIFDESLLTTSTRPVELVWRMEVMAKDVPLPIREMVLVNAQTGVMSFHVNQVHTDTMALPANPATITCSIVNGTASPALFLPYKQYNCGMNPYGVGIGDFNNDGRKDVALSARGNSGSQHSLLIFLQDGSGNLSSQPTTYSAGNHSTYLAVADLNNDGREDVVTSDTADGTISVFLQQGNGTLANRVTYSTGNLPGAIAVGDVNSDGRKDVAIVLANNAVIGVFRQSQTGTLQTIVKYASIVSGEGDIAIGDVNGDGRNDVVKMNGQGETPDLMVYLQNSGNTLDPYTSYGCTPVCAGAGIGIGDVTGDGRSDVVMSYGGNTPESNIAVFKQSTSGSLQAPVSYRAYDIPSPVEIADVDSNNLMDVVTLHSGWLSAGVFSQLSNGSLYSEILYGIPYKSHFRAQDLSIGDLNNDNLPDLAIADGVGLTVLYRNTTVPSTPTLTPRPSRTPTSTLTFTPGPGPSRTPGPTSTAGPSPTSVPPTSTGSRKTYTASGNWIFPGTFLCDQSTAVCTGGADPDADKAHRYAADTFVFYNTHHKRNSFDHQGGTIVSTVHFGVGYQNAFWDGYQMVYGDGMTADDIVGHEITHGVTQYSSNLIYSYQSGAINESFSDLWGEFIDQTNGSGNDAASVKWLMGEDTPLGALRSMSDPTLFGDPDKMSSPYYYYGSDDDGGVHFNSGVNNKAAYLMVEGGIFNSRTITGIGLNKTAAIYYEVQANLLTAGSNYNDLYYALVQACQNLVGGASGLTQNDCNQVKTAAEAVEMVVVSPPTTGSNPLYLSLTNSQTFGGISSADEDILYFDGTNWSLFFDGSDVGAGSTDLSSFAIVESNLILMSFSSAVTVDGISVTPQDILRFDATSLGSTTSGTFDLLFDGSDVGFDDSTEKIDAITVLPDARLLISTTGNPVVPGVSGARDEDVLAFTPTTYGNTTAGSWSMYFDGSDVGLGETSGEDVDALSVANGNIYLSTLDAFSVTAISGADEDIFVCALVSTGSTTACTYQPSLYFDGSRWGLDANDVDGFQYPHDWLTTPVPPVTSTPTLTLTPAITVSPDNTFLFVPEADARVSEASPTTNYGTATTLLADRGVGVTEVSYIRFAVSGMNGSIQNVKLRLFCTTNGTTNGPAVFLADNNWIESGTGGITWNPQPAILSDAFDNKGAIAASSWVEYDVTALVTGDGTYTFALGADGTDGVTFSSREGTMPPQLLITLGTGAPTFTPTATLVPSVTPPPPTTTLIPTVTSTATQTGNILSLTPLADVYVNAASPANNYGAASILRVDASPDVHSYLRFDVQGLSGTVTKATLRLYANTASSLGCTVNSVADNTWSESMLTYNNAPPIGGALGSSVPFGAGTWIEIDVTSYITGNGTYNLALTTSSSTAVSFTSRETGDGPQLVIETIP